MSAKTSAQKCNKLISTIAKQGAAFEALVQDATKACLEHAKIYHDVTLCVKLIQTVTEVIPGYAVNQLVQYMSRHSPIKFEYSADKKNIVNAKEAKDKDGNLTKAYSPNDVLEKAPFIVETRRNGSTQREIQPFSILYLKGQIARLKGQLENAVKEDGRGILLPGGTEKKPKIAHDLKTPEAQAAYEKLKTVLNGLEGSVNNVVDMLAPSTDKLIRDGKEVNTEEANDRSEKPKGRSKTAVAA